MAASEHVLATIRDFFGHMIERLFGESGKAIALEAATVLEDATLALLRNLAATGVRDGAALLLELRRINEQENASGATSDDKYAAFMSAGRIALQRFGGDVAHEAVNTTLDTVAGLFHQPDKAAALGAPAKP